jgi:hypothetical protein
METYNFQRIGAKNNTHAGNEFEALVGQFFANQGMILSTNFSVPLGVADLKKSRRFDLGSENPPVLVECKSHNWTVGRNVPSAKMTVWNESMYYFHIAPERYRKILFCLKSMRNAESLASYYVRCYPHLIPLAVELWEYSIDTHSAERVK